MNVALQSKCPSSAALAGAIGRKAICALYAELALYPKPGLVSPVDQGSHLDMDMGTFMRSLFALRNYFRDIATAGAQRARFQDLQSLGLAAERRMLIATGGTNTHRGAIFTLGLLAAAAAAVLARNDSIDGDTLGQAVADYWGDEIRACAKQAPSSNGVKAVRRYGVGGARQQAADGFPLLFDLALPTLQTTLLATHDRQRALVQALFALMSELDDTNVLHRGGVDGLAFVKSQASIFLDAGGIHSPQWRTRAQAFHHECIARRLSPGGAADLLAAAIFVNELRTTL